MLTPEAKNRPDPWASSVDYRALLVKYMSLVLEITQRNWSHPGDTYTEAADERFTDIEFAVLQDIDKEARRT